MVVKFGETMKISPKIMSSLCCYGQTFHKISCDLVLRYVQVENMSMCGNKKNPPHELLISLGIQ